MEVVDDSFSSFLPGVQPDNTCICEFYLAPKLMAFKSRAEGRPIYEDREMVKIMVKGQDKQIFTREATDEDKQRFPREYAAFKMGREVAVVGTPIDMLPGVGPSFVQNMKAKGVKTIEDFVNLSDESLMNVGPGGRELQRRAKAMLGQTVDETIQLKDELNQERVRRENLEAQIQALMEKVNDLSDRKKGKHVASDNRPGNR
jgi:hypothetical protein